MLNFLKKVALFLTIAITSSDLYSQVVTFEPSFATQFDTLTLTFDATKGNGGLAGFTGDVFLHTGVITNLSSNDSDWRYVQSGWDSYPSKLKATFLGNDKWEFQYPSSVKEFYGVPLNETVEKVSLLFRGTNDGSGNPDKVGRDIDNGDIFLTLFEEQVAAQFIFPSKSSKIIKSSEVLEIKGKGTSPSGVLNLSLKLEENIVAQTSIADSLLYSFSSTNEGNFDFKLIADDGIGNADSVSLKVIVSDGAKPETRPSGLQDGITYGNDGTSVTLSLFAPGKRSVFAIGDFSDWNLDFDYEMKKDSLNPDSVWFWTEITGLTSGQQYGFQYEVDGALRIADPYSELVLHPSGDSGISESIFPNLKPYPSGKTSNYVGVLSPGKPEYNWTATGYQRPAKEELVIYELLVRDFLGDHSFSSLIDTLDYLDRLGINAIELMPVSEFDGNESWGYNPNFHLALDKYYGTPEKFKEFVDEAHKRGIAVILDVVMNHATGQNSLYRLYEFGNNPYFNTLPRHAFNVFNDFNHQYSGTQYYSKRMIEYWIEEYKIDGFRWDLTKGFTQNCTAGDEVCTGNFQQDRVDLLKKYADYQWAADTDFYVIFEHLGISTEEREWADYRIDEGKGIMLWGNMNGAYNEATMGYISGSNLNRVISESRGFQEKRLIGYMESHDEQWLMFKNISFGNSNVNYDVKELNTALGRQKLAGAFFFTLPGPKMMWQFGELGYGYGNNGEQCLKPGDGSNGDCPSFAPSRVGNKSIRWDYLNDGERVKLYKTWGAIINLRRASSAFTEPDLLTHSLDGAVKWIKIRDVDTDVVIMGNFDITGQVLDLAFPSIGTWYNYFEGTEMEIVDGNTSFSLKPGEFRIYTTRKFQTPEEGILTENEATDGTIPKNYRLHNNYPNPFNPSTKLRYDIPKTGPVKLEVFDILGRKVANVLTGTKPAGSYSVIFDASALSSGVYIVRFKAGNFVQTQKITLLK